MRPLRRVAVGLVAAALAICALAPTAAGHAVLLSSVPADGAVVRAAPPVIELVFSEPVESVGARVRVIGADGGAVSTDAPVTRGRTLSVAPTATVPEGTVTVAWSVISADGHRVDGAVAFAVGAPSGPAADVGASAAPPGSDAAASAVRAARFAAIVALVGVAIILVGAWIPAIRRGRELDRTTAEAADTAVRRSLARFAVACCALLVLAALAWIPVDAWANGIGITDAIGLRQGIVNLLMLALGLVAAPLALLGIRARQDAGVVGFALAAALLAALPAFAGHAVGEDPAWPSILVDVAHVLAAGAWGGGVIALAAGTPALIGSTGSTERAPLVAGVIRRFTRIALVALVVLVATGATATVLYAGSLRDVPDTSWGRVLIAKVAIVAVAVLVAGLVRRGGDRYATGIRVEALLIVSAIAATGVLTGLAPTTASPAQTGGPLSAQAQGAGVLVQLDVSPGRAGEPNEVHLIAIAPDGSPARGVRDGEVVLSSRENGIDRLPVRLERIERGHWAGAIVIPAAGRWSGTGRVRAGEFDEVVATGAFDVIPSGG